MPRGRVSPLPAEQQEFLRSHQAEFDKLQAAHTLTPFWSKVSREWFQRWPVEPRLGLAILNTGGVAIEDSGVPLEHQRAVARKKTAKAEGGTGVAAVADVQNLLTTLIGKRGRKLHHTEIWQKRNQQAMTDALRAEGYEELMPAWKENESAEERKAAVGLARKAQMAMRRKVVRRMWAAAKEGEKAEVEKIYNAQGSKGKIRAEEKRSPAEYQEGLDSVGPILRGMHEVLHEVTGWIGATVMTGPTPSQGGKIGTQSSRYCFGVTPAGNTLEQSMPRWDEEVMKPLGQFGKRCFNHEIRAERALPPTTTTEQSNNRAEPNVNAMAAPSKRQPRKRPPKRTQAANEGGEAINTATHPDTTSLDTSTDLDTDIDPASSSVFATTNTGIDGDTIHTRNADATSIVFGSTTTSTYDDCSRSETTGTPSGSGASIFGANSSAFDSGSFDDAVAFENGGEDDFGIFEDTSTGSGDNASIFGRNSADSGSGWGTFVDLNPLVNTEAHVRSTLPTHPFELRSISADSPSRQILDMDAPFIYKPDLSTTPWTAPPSNNPAPMALSSCAPVPTTPLAAPPLTNPPPTTPSSRTPRPTPRRLVPHSAPGARRNSSVGAPSPLRLVHTAPSTPTGAGAASAVSTSCPPTPPAGSVATSTSSPPVPPPGSVAISTSSPPVPRPGSVAIQTMETTALQPDDFPESRPMSNAPHAAKPAARGGGRGGGQGGRGSRGGQGGRGGKSQREGRGGELGGGLFGGEISLGGSSGQASATAGPYRFLQTYDDDGNVIPLPLDTPMPGPSAARTKEIREFEKKRDQQEAKDKKAARERAKFTQEYGNVVVMPPPPAGTEPLGARTRRAPSNRDDYVSAPLRKRTLAEIRAAASEKKLLEREAKLPTKRKGNAENEEPERSSKRAMGLKLSSRPMAKG
ncbi:hypothetical protein B0H11DRAFT_1920279 [Mycena galericulata]|nr:hypothetical protein B0H11DRAFT_1920279 [Mycena galericulata]